MYLFQLELHGMNINEKDNMAATSEEGGEFLERIMYINEELHSNPSQERLKFILKDNESE